jgi:hypothetical protein
MGNQANINNQVLNNTPPKAPTAHQLRQGREEAKASLAGSTHNQESCIVCFVVKIKATKQGPAK